MGATFGLSTLTDVADNLGEITQACANARRQVEGCRSSLQTADGVLTAYAGLMFGENIGAEVFYANLGSYDLAFTGYETTSLSAEAVGGAIRLVGNLQEDERGTYKGFIRIGVHDYEASVSATPTNIERGRGAKSFSASSSDSDLVYGFGWQYIPKTSSGGVVWGIDRYELDSFAVNTLYIGWQTR